MASSGIADIVVDTLLFQAYTEVEETENETTILTKVRINSFSFRTPWSSVAASLAFAKLALFLYAHSY